MSNKRETPPAGTRGQHKSTITLEDNSESQTAIERSNKILCDAELAVSQLLKSRGLPFTYEVIEENNTADQVDEGSAEWFAIKAVLHFYFYDQHTDPEERFRHALDAIRSQHLCEIKLIESNYYAGKGTKKGGAKPELPTEKLQKEKLRQKTIDDLKKKHPNWGLTALREKTASILGKGHSYSALEKAKLEPSF